MGFAELIALGDSSGMTEGMPDGNGRREGICHAGNSGGGLEYNLYAVKIGKSRPSGT